MSYIKYQIESFLLEPSYKFPLKNREDIKVVMPNECDDQGFKVDKDGDEEEDLFEELEAEMALKSGVSSRSWPEAIYVYVKFGYDRTLKNQLENSDGTDFATWTDAIMTHVQGHYRHPTLPTKIEFKVLSQSFKLHALIFYKIVYHPVLALSTAVLKRVHCGWIKSFH